LFVIFVGMNNNPFPTTQYFGPETFCNRDHESKTIISNIENNNSTTLTAIRRMGKTGLIFHVFELMKRDIIPVYADILATSNKLDFVNVLSAAIANAASEKSSLGKKIWKFIKSLRPVISFDPLSGNPQVSITGTESKTENDIHALLNFLNNLDVKVVIAIDEFQQILEYPDQIMDAWLRSVIQTLPNIVFVFSGSRQHLMAKLFADPGRPFFRSTQILHFSSIHRETYQQFIVNQFEKHRRTIPNDLAGIIWDWASGHTYYVQLLSNRLFANCGKQISDQDIQNEIVKILQEQEIIFYQYRELLTKSQWNLLKAVGIENVVTSPSSSEFVSSYKLGSSAAVLRSLDALVTKEMIYIESDENGQKNYQVYDVLLRRWLQAKFTKQQ
jgi:uncharacterized protein